MISLVKKETKARKWSPLGIIWVIFIWACKICDGIMGQNTWYQRVYKYIHSIMCDQSPEIFLSYKLKFYTCLKLTQLYTPEKRKRKKKKSSSQPSESLPLQLAEQRHIHEWTHIHAATGWLPRVSRIASWVWMLSNPFGNAELSPLCNESLILFDLQILSRWETCSIIPRLVTKYPGTYLFTWL